jgi:succinate-semialdehyde dehydrogenase/glutarate-semialdehyde dehydrogenase
MLISLNPASNKIIGQYHEHDTASVETILQQTHATFREWRRTSFTHRAGLMRRAAAVLRGRCDELALLAALEMGKPVVAGRAEIEKCAQTCEYYAEHAEAFLTDCNIPTGASRSFVNFQPLGTILAVMPWNFPFWQVFRFAAPTLMAGNAAVLKHASNVTGCALAIETIFREAGFPEHLFRTLKIPGSKLTPVIAHPLIQAVTLTGSVAAGRAVAEAAGRVLKKCVLELGGSDPYLVLEDADLDLAVSVCVNSRLINSGQSCVAAKRFIVIESIRAEFEQRFVELMRGKKMGDPQDESNDLGPQARHDLRDELHQQVVDSVSRGAVCLLGGEIPRNEGAYYPPTVLTNVNAGMPAHDDELFGPVAAIISARSEQHAISIANNSCFGLGAAVFTRDVAKGERIAAQELEAGCCFVNDNVKSDPRLPFGGIKDSGYGRELSDFGIREFVNIKTVSVR